LTANDPVRSEQWNAVVAAGYETTDFLREIMLWEWTVGGDVFVDKFIADHIRDPKLLHVMVLLAQEQWGDGSVSAARHLMQFSREMLEPYRPQIEDLKQSEEGGEFSLRIEETLAVMDGKEPPHHPFWRQL
jgi:hypothetical protein